MAAAAGAAVAAATAGQDEDPQLPGPPIGRRAVCSRPYFMVLMVFAHLYVFSVLGLLLFVHISADDGDPDPTQDSASPAQDAPASAPAGSSSYALPRLEGIKASMSGHRAVRSARGAAALARRQNGKGLQGGRQNCPRVAVA
ncbi:hypothetical protein lerEdw1_015583 [Lerista edwardsae]|nr:hypothetical protein lerEdw1_015583 [Lerista edwardsae]